MAWVWPPLLKMAILPPVPTVAKSELATVWPWVKLIDDVPGRLVPYG